MNSKESQTMSRAAATPADSGNSSNNPIALRQETLARADMARQRFAESRDFTLSTARIIYGPTREDL